MVPEPLTVLQVTVPESERGLPQLSFTLAVKTRVVPAATPADVGEMLSCAAGPVSTVTLALADFPLGLEAVTAE
jgi:hypothetical protein